MLLLKLKVKDPKTIFSLVLNRIGRFSQETTEPFSFLETVAHTYRNDCIVQLEILHSFSVKCFGRIICN